MAENTGWDIFISHASEDKDEIVRPLAKSLSAFGIRVWFDEYELQLGDSLSRSIDRGLAQSNFGLVVLSKSFFEKKWPEYELRGLVTQEFRGRALLPIWHGVTHEEVAEFSPTLADKLAISTAEKSENEIAFEIVRRIAPETFEAVNRRVEYEKRLGGKKVEVASLDGIKAVPIIHDELPQEFVGRAKLIWLVCFPYYQVSFEKWLEGFRRDAHPTKELAVWERIASAFLETKVQMQGEPSAEVLQDAFSVSLANSLVPSEAPVQVQSKHLNDKEIEDIGWRFLSPWPILGAAFENDIEFDDGDADSETHRSKLPDIENLVRPIPNNLVEQLRVARSKTNT